MTLSRAVTCVRCGLPPSEVGALGLLVAADPGRAPAWLAPWEDRGRLRGERGVCLPCGVRAYNAACAGVAP